MDDLEKLQAIQKIINESYFGYESKDKIFRIREIITEESLSLVNDPEEKIKLPFFVKSNSEKIKNAIKLIDKKFDIMMELSHSEKIDKESVFNILEQIRKELT